MIQKAVGGSMLTSAQSWPQETESSNNTQSNTIKLPGKQNKDNQSPSSLVANSFLKPAKKDSSETVPTKTLTFR